MGESREIQELKKRINDLEKQVQAATRWIEHFARKQK